MAIDEQILIERILEAENLTDNLEDEPASLLLKWGTGQVSRLAQNSEDQEHAGERINGLMAVMRKINRLAGNLDSAEAEELAADLARLVELHAQAFGHARDASAEDLKAAAAALAQTPASEAVPFVLKWLAPGAPDQK